MVRKCALEPVWCSPITFLQTWTTRSSTRSPLAPPRVIQRSNECVLLTGPLAALTVRRRWVCGQAPTSSVDDEIALSLGQPTGDVDHVEIRFLRGQ
jgi:hypothetical protein